LLVFGARSISAIEAPATVEELIALVRHTGPHIGHRLVLLTLSQLSKERYRGEAGNE
jgi:hypothetical protein